jgi:hypothetical protein
MMGDGTVFFGVSCNNMYCRKGPTLVRKDGVSVLPCSRKSPLYTFQEMKRATGRLIVHDRVRLVMFCFATGNLDNSECDITPAILVD